jgi:hypothetical protein
VLEHGRFALAIARFEDRAGFFSVASSASVCSTQTFRLAPDDARIGAGCILWLRRSCRGHSSRRVLLGDFISVGEKRYAPLGQQEQSTIRLQVRLSSHTRTTSHPPPPCSAWVLATSSFPPDEARPVNRGRNGNHLRRQLIREQDLTLATPTHAQRHVWHLVDLSGHTRSLRVVGYSSQHSRAQ